MKYINKEHTVIQDGNRSIPVDINNKDYQEILESGSTIDSYIEPIKSIQEINNDINLKLIDIDIASIRSIREWIALQSTATILIKQHETDAINLRNTRK